MNNDIERLRQKLSAAIDSFQVNLNLSESGLLNEQVRELRTHIETILDEEDNNKRDTLDEIYSRNARAEYGRM